MYIMPSEWRILIFGSFDWILKNHKPVNGVN